MPGIVADWFLKPAVKFYKRNIVKDPFSVSVKKWKRDRGESTLRLDYPLNENSIVIDVGGFHGDFAHAMTERFGCRVLLFEPMPLFAEQCRERFGRNHRVSVYDFGLGERDEVLSLSNSSDASSFFVGQQSGPTVTAQLRDVSAVWRELDLTHVDLMKINIEGGEYPLLRRMLECRLLQQVDHVQVQFHDFVDDAKQQRDDLRLQMAQTHDETWCYTFVWENWSQKKAAA